MKLFSKAFDGGPESHVTGYWLIEIKPLFSIVLLRFGKGTREAFHTHAFNAVTWFLRGRVVEHMIGGESKQWAPSLKAKYTPRECFHKVEALETTYAISFRGPWAKRWNEYLPAEKKFVTLSSGRKVVGGT